MKKHVGPLLDRSLYGEEKFYAVDIVFKILNCVGANITACGDKDKAVCASATKKAVSSAKTLDTIITSVTV